jgi:hypothetical protein
MAWFANVNVLLWRFVDKIDDEGCALIPKQQIWVCTVLPSAAFWASKHTTSVLSLCGSSLAGTGLVADEDKRVLELMKKEEKNLARKVLAEDRFAAHLRYLRSGSFMERVRDLVTVAMGPKPKPRL